jgi:hypothetical protein
MKIEPGVNLPWGSKYDTTPGNTFDLYPKWTVFFPLGISQDIFIEPIPNIKVDI